jgi:hypothetical protein
MIAQARLRALSNGLEPTGRYATEAFDLKIGETIVLVDVEVTKPESETPAFGEGAWMQRFRWVEHVRSRKRGAA